MSRVNTQKIILTEELREDILMYVRAEVENSKIAKILQISEKSLYNLYNSNPDLKAEIDECKTISNARIENSFYNQAIGYYKEEEKVVTLSGGLHGHSTTEVVKYMKYYPPNFQAGKHYANNRDPNRWKDKNELTIRTEDMTDAEVERLAKKIMNGEDVEETED